MMSDKKIEVKNLSFKYETTDVLKNVSFDVYDKDIVTIIGPNGGGKSRRITNKTKAEMIKIESE